MDDRMDAVKAELEAVSFVGETLAPFFLQDPRTGTAGAAFQAVAQLRAQEAADAWPFADGAEARHALSLMVNGLADGVRRTTDERTPEDHIGLMLALMSYLARNQPDDLDEFLQIHLLTWSSHFLDQLVEAADHPFYEGLARLAKASLEGIQQARDIDVTYPRFYR